MDDWVDVDADVEMQSNLAIRTVGPTESTDPAISFYNAVEQGAQKRLEALKSPVFHVELDKKSLYETFVKNLAPELAQEYACSTCKHFVSRYGDLALVDEYGSLEPLLWALTDLDGDSELTGTFFNAVQALRKEFENKKVTAEFKVAGKKVAIGSEKQGGFTHMRLRFPQSRIRKEELAGFTSADTATLAIMLDRILADYELSTIRRVNTILFENKLPYADNHKASAKWLLELVEDNKMAKTPGSVARHNLLYRYAASSFIGSLKQMRSGALGTLLEAVKQDLPWSDILAQWQGVCNPTSYMRPQVAPSAGNIQAAERLFQQLGLTKNDLRRRLLVQDDVPENVVIWRSERMKQRKKVDITANIFSNVKAKAKTFEASQTVNSSPPTVMTFTRFVTKVLPTAKRVDCWLESRDIISTLITGFAGTKPLMQWHDEEGKNLASHYLWTVPPAVESHNLKSKAWNEVRCLIPFPWLWDGAPLTTTFPLVDPDNEESHRYKYYHKQKGFRYLFVLEENHESNLRLLPLFPEMLKSEFHGVRSTIEAFTKTARLDDVDDGAARGGFVAGVEASRSTNNQKLHFKVENFKGEVGLYNITLFEG